MSDVFKLDYDAVSELILKGPAAMNAVEQMAKEYSQTFENPSEVTVKVGTRRCRAEFRHD